MGQSPESGPPGKTRMSRPRWPVVWLLVLLGTLSVCMQHVTLVKFSVFAPGSSHGSLTSFLRAVDRQIDFSLFDGLLAALFLLGTALLLYVEARHRRLTQLLHECFASPRKSFWLLTACLLVCLRYYLARGELSWAADASHHIATSWLAAQAIADGQLPVWTFFIGTGSPVFQTYGFAFFYLVGLVDLVLGDLFLTLKLVMAAAHVLSGLGMYYLAASLCRSRSAGFVAGLAYALCFWHTQHVLLMGRLPLSLFYALLPWAFYWIEQVVDSERRMRAALLGGASLALLACTHPGYGAFAMALAGCYGLVRLWSCRRGPDRGAVLGAGLLLFALGIVFGSYINVGMYFESGYTRMHDFAMDLSSPPDPTWRHLLGWSNFRFWLIPPEPYHWYGGYLGVSLCAMALAGGVALLRRWEERFAACWVLPDPHPSGRLRLPPAAHQLAAADPLLQRFSLPALRGLLPGSGGRHRRPHAPAAGPGGAGAQPPVHAPAPGHGLRSLPHDLHSALLPQRELRAHGLEAGVICRSHRGGLAF